MLARTTSALLLANARYWPTVALGVRRELRHTALRAQEIADPDDRRLALEKLHDEGFNARAAAMLATLAPRAHREHAAHAIVALELLFDYLDGLTERPTDDPLAEGERLFTPFTQAIAIGTEGARRGATKADRTGADRTSAPKLADEGYPQELSATVSDALARLPAAGAIAEVARASAARAAQAQIQMHAAASIGTEQLEEWARGEAHGTGPQWRERLAGSASSVLALHALIAAAADPGTTREHATAIDEAYLSICSVVTLLDGLVDHGADKHNGEPSYISLYDNDELLARALSEAARRALRQTRELPGAAHHVMTFAAAVAYYASAPGANSDRARPVLKRLRRELSPLLSPPLLLMHAWRAAESARGRRRNIDAHTSVERNMVSSC
ncbi:MAG: DUF2600 family protein [Solirubrobacteraceae bacterium]